MIDQEFEYALFKITDPKKFKDFMLEQLNMLKDNDQYGFRVVTLGCGTEPFEWEKYTAYLENSGATDTSHGFYLNLDEWIQMGRPDKNSDILSERIEKELT